MTSQERKENRYQRRKAKRLELKRKRTEKFDDFNKVFTYDHLYKSYLKCRKMYVGNPVHRSIFPMPHLMFMKPMRNYITVLSKAMAFMNLIFVNVENYGIYEVYQ